MELRRARYPMRADLKVITECLHLSFQILKRRPETYSPSSNRQIGPIYFSVTSGKLKGSHRFASVIHAFRNRV
jgi:hypothetical protein